MVRDLPESYKFGGYVGGMLEDSLKRTAPIWCAKIDVYFKDHYGTGYSFFSSGDFRPDLVDACQELIHDLNKYENTGIRFPSDWMNAISSMKGLGVKFKNNDISLKVGAYDIKKVAELAKDGHVKNAKYAKGCQILSKEDFLIEFRGAYADRILNWNHFQDAHELVQPPSKDKLARMIKEAGQVFDQYVNIPVGSLIVTKDFIFPYVLGRKKYQDLRWFSDKHCSYNDESGPRIPTADNAVHLTGKDNDSHTRESPVLRVNLDFPMDFIRNSFVVDQKDEKSYLMDTIESQGQFNSIWVQGASGLPKDVTSMQGSNWHPSKDELVRVIKEILKIRD